MSDLTDRLRAVAVRGGVYSRDRANVLDAVAVLDALDALHQPYARTAACNGCRAIWPCDTHLLLHPMPVEAIDTLGPVHK